MEIGKIEKGCQLLKDLERAKTSVRDSLPFNLESLPDSYVKEVQEAIYKVLDEKVADTEQTIKNLANAD